MFGETLRQLRTERKLSIDKLSENLNAKYDMTISKSMISRWENSQTDPKMEYVRIIADYFQVSADRLLGIKEAQKESNPFDTLAAHAADRDHEFTPEEIDRIKGYIDGIIDNYESKHSDNK